MKYFELKGQDNYLFRDGRAFSKGSDFKARTIFPPLPLVLRGTLRTAYFSSHMEEFIYAGTEKDPTEQIKIQCMMLRYKGSILIPLPLNTYLSRKKEEEEWKAKLLTLQESPKYSSHPLPYVLGTEDELREISEVTENDYARLEDVIKLMSGEKIEISIFKLSEIMVKEIKTGIAIDRNTGRSADQMYYETELVYPYDGEGNSIDILVAAEGMDHVDLNGMVKLGGEGKTASARTIEDFSKQLKKPEKISKHFALTLLSPSIFENGWYPGFIDRETKVGEISGTKIQLVAVAVGRSVPISGFDMKKRRPKPLYHGVPAGTVYYFEILEGDAQEVIDFLHRKNISDKWKAEGLGYSVIFPITVEEH